MSGKVIFKNAKDLYNYIEEYKSTKPSNSANSLGIVFDEHEYFYWYDSGTGKVLNIDKDIAFLLNNLTNSSLSLDNVLDIISKRNIDDSNLIDIINTEDLLKGFKINSLHCSDFLKHTHKKIQDGVSQLILELTEKCNMRCKYCIYSEGYSGNRSFGAASMSRDTALKAINLIAEDGDPNMVYITFYGGEPLLEFNLLKEVIEYSKEKLSDRKLTFSFTTNLTLLTPSMVDYFSTVDNLSILCSIDGPKSVHDQYRVYYNQSGTFEDVMKNFKLLCSVYEKNKTFSVSVNAVYMPPYSKSKVETIYDFFSNLDFVPDTFTYQLGYPTPDTIPEELKDETFNGDMSIQDWQNELVSQANSFDELKESSVINAYDKIHKRIITLNASNSLSLNGCCTPGYRRLYVKTNGYLIPCERIGYSPTIGDVSKGIDLDAIYSKYIFEYSDKLTSYCNDCWAAKLCSSCYIGRMDKNGVKNIEIKSCEYERMTNLVYLEKYHHLLRVNPEKLNILNDNQII